ncbi:MAG: hypothetical protein Q7T36_15155 [Fluviicoccus sp.]|uniref:hypothetical protein n=1 Tax=Fluviicoccus sp. TaxID=2003552 RepID=UPI002722037A|nr:hypothetical protein [Fluviicoccus sp.]MDO8331802.1 hypothetical protein [Fluviicoccus sp.]
MKGPTPFAKATALMACVLTASPAFALENLSDTDLSGEVARDGVTFKLILADFDGAGAGTDLGLSVGQTLLHDGDGTPGAIVHGTSIVGDRLELTMAAGSVITTMVDAVGDASALPGNQAMLNINIDVPAFTLKTGKLYAARSNGTGAVVSDLSGAITEGMTLNVGALTVNAQLGTENQGYMLLVNGNMAGGITGSNFVLNDVNSGGGIRINTIAIENNGASTALDVSVGVDIGPAGLVAEVIQLGTLAGGMDLQLGGVKLGNAGATSIGNVDIVGLNLASTLIQISGHL